MLAFLRRFLPFLPKPPPVVPVVRLEGVIDRGSGGRVSRNISLATVEEALDRAFKTGGAPAVALVVNSPGGSPVQSRLIHDRVRALSAKHEKRVFVFCEDLAASGGYMIALSADEIWVDASTIVGSIGVIGAMFGAQEAIAKLGIERRVYTAGRNKLRLDPFQPEKPEDVAWVKVLQAALHAEFIALVKARRGVKLKEDEPGLFEGDVWLGRRALEVGLVDGVGHLREVLREQYGDTVRFRVLNAAKPPLLARLFGAGADGIVDALLERMAWARFGL
jgi:signal peptide peptidase SppA